MAELRVNSKLDSTGFESGINNMSRSVQGFGSQLKNIAGGFGLAFGGAALIGMARKVTRLGSDLTDMATQAGLTTEEFQVFEFMARKAGVSADKIRSAMGRLNVVMGQAQGGMKRQVDLLQLVGVAQEDISKLKTTQVLERVAQTMATATRGSEEFGAAVEILGTRTGIQLTEVLQELAEKGFAKAGEEAKKAGAIMDDELAQKLDKVEDNAIELERALTATLGSIAFDVIDGFALIGETGATVFTALTNNLFTVQDALDEIKAIFSDVADEIENLPDDPFAALAEDPILAKADETPSEASARRLGLDEKGVEKRQREFEKRSSQFFAKQEQREFDRMTTTGQIALLELEIFQIAKNIGSTFNRDALDELETREAILDREIKLDKLLDKQATKKETAEKQAERSADKLKKLDEKEAAISGGKGVSIASSIANEIARIGGVLGGFVSPEARLAERNISIQEKLKSLADDRNDILNDIANKDPVSRFE